MNISLTPELEKWVQSKVESGLYGSSSEVIREALRLFHQFDEGRALKLARLREDIQTGLEQLKAGSSKKMTPSLMQEIKKRGRGQLDG
ncbi:MAG: type II toxin-antitoxin system ParD family antitoxin [Oceanipulchritudo sp.]|jgi:antitoxin ParD1/3/4